MSTQAVPQPQQDPIISMVQDPDFAKLPPMEQRKALAAHDPVFQQAGDDAIGQFIQAHQAKQSVIPKPTAAPQPKQAPEGFLTSLGHAAGIPTSLDELKNYGIDTAINSMALGMPISGIVRAKSPGQAIKAAAGPVVPIAQSIGSEASDLSKMQAPTSIPAANEDLQRLIRIGATQFGPGGTQTYDKAAAGDIKGAAGTGIGTLLPYVAGAAAGGPEAGKIGKPVPVSEDAAIANIRKAVNPAPTDAGFSPGAHHGTGFSGELADQIHTIVDHGQKTGLPDQLAQAKTPGAALNATAETVRSAAKADPYFKSYIEPNLNEVFPTSRIKGYSGGTVGEGGNAATLDQLNKRLSTINDTLSPKYSRGGAGSVAAQNAVGAEQAASMQVEAAGIRMTIAQELSKRTGIPAEQLAGMRKNYGQMSDLADTIQSRANETLQQEFTEANKQLKVKDVIPTVNNPAGILGKIPVQKNPIISSLKKAFSMVPNPAEAMPQVTPPSVVPRPPSASRAALQTQTIPPRVAVDQSVLTPEVMRDLQLRFSKPAAAPQQPRVPIWQRVANNASGESAASQEAISRVASEKTQGIQRVRIDTRSGKETPLIGADAVDIRPGKFDRIMMRYPNGRQVELSRGSQAR